jgi:hypothetical protein
MIARSRVTMPRWWSESVGWNSIARISDGYVIRWRDPVPEADSVAIVVVRCTTHLTRTRCARTRPASKVRVQSVKSSRILFRCCIVERSVIRTRIYIYVSNTARARRTCERQLKKFLLSAFVHDVITSKYESELRRDWGEIKQTFSHSSMLRSIALCTLVTNCHTQQAPAAAAAAAAASSNNRFRFVVMETIQFQPSRFAAIVRVAPIQSQDICDWILYNRC